MSGGHAERALRDSTPQLKDLWVARAFELAQRQCAVTHALTKLTLNGKPVRMGANVVTRALAKSVQRQAQLSQLLDSRGTQLDWRDQMFSDGRWTVCWSWRDSKFRTQECRRDDIDGLATETMDLLPLPRCHYLKTTCQR